MIAFWDVTHRNLTQVDPCFRDAFCLHYQEVYSPEDGGSTQLRNSIQLVRDYEAIFKTAAVRI
jgi:hypothetical protein